MNIQEINQLNNCKLQIEQKLSWVSSSEWKQRDFLNLIDLIQEKTGVCLSLSTIKRIWKPGFEGTPHPTTLDALAQFLEYAHWLDYKSKNGSESKFQSKEIQTSRKYKSYIISGSIVIACLFAGILFFQANNKPESESGVFYNPAKVSFECNTTVSAGVPNTVVFTYNAKNIEADSFFIQQSWDRFRRDKVDKQNSKLSSTYFYPGYHKAKLIANDSIVHEVGVRVNTNGWLAVARYGYMDGMPTYIREADVQANGKLRIAPHHFNNNKIPINKELMSSYFYINEFKGLSSSNFTFETRIKCDSIINVACPNIGIVISGEGAMNFIPLTIKGCVGNAFVKFGDVAMNGKENDFSSFGTNVFEWQTIKVEVFNKLANVYLNDIHIFEQAFEQDIKEITGCNLNFSGAGSIDYVRFYNKNKELVYDEGF